MSRLRRVERLARREESRVIKRVLWLSVVSIIIIILIFTVGISTLGKFADFTSGLLGKKSDSASVDKTIPQAPQLDPISDATNSATFKVGGFSEGAKVDIYLNGNKADTVTVSDGKFKSDDLHLKDGKNEINAKTIGANGKESDATDVVHVLLDTKDPDLSVDTPSDGQSFSGDNRIKVAGKTDSDAQVYANGFLANINSDGHFDVSVPLVEGDNKIEVKALDSAGNTKVETRKVSFKK